MARKVQHSVRWEGWLVNAVDAWGKKNSDKNFSDSVNFLLGLELERWGYKRKFYEPGLIETPPDGEVLSISDLTDQAEQSNRKIRPDWTEERFFELLPYFPENIKNQIAEEKLDWKQLPKRLGPAFSLILSGAEKDESNAKKKGA